MSEELLAELRAAEQTRTAALLRQDLGLLQALLHDDLSYTHSNAKRDSKEELLAAVANGFLRYSSLTHDLERAVGAAEAAVATGRMRGAISVANSELQIDTVTTTTWVKESGKWTLIAFHATPVATP